MYKATINDDDLKRSLKWSAALHFCMFLFLFFGLPHMMPPLPAHHGSVPFDIVTIGEMTNTKIGDSKDNTASSPPPAPAQKPTAPPPTPKEPSPPSSKPSDAKAEPEAEALEALNKPRPKAKPTPPKVEPVAKPDLLASVLKNVEKMKQTVPAQQMADIKADAKPANQSGEGAGTGVGASYGSRLMISEEDALRRQIEQCWNPPIGARDAQSLIVEVVIDVNPDRTVIDADVVDKFRYASDPFFRAAADSAIRAVRSPKCNPLELPADKYEQWKRIYFNFDPRDML